MIKIENELTAEEYNSLRKEIGWETKNDDIINNAIKESKFVKKAILDNKVVGMARVIGDGIYYLVVDVVVSSKYQNMGIGKMLMKSLEDDIYSVTPKGQKCSINLVSMSGKESFYEKCGFEKIPIGYTGNGMIKRIEKGSENDE